ncbi:DUF3443 domain-containing protein [Paraburkholderia acidisoli]|uniref:DUF3443 family protein n=1 Tax=Paraburkholderia acidisoli TaxID=2571748 RepID=A0A7Z2JDH4_9BURK|nr:DUF3443 domain-containing protein [Paraburkholderia acidisoli]QGZ61177.1 DUF3443 family protein [Paraburkholderia acidisoli]
MSARSRSTCSVHAVLAARAFRAITTTRPLRSAFARRFACLLCAALAACGGGSSGSNASGAATPASAPVTASAPTAASTPATPPVTTTGAVTPSTTPNVMPVSVAATPTLTRNMLMASVTVCVPGTATCATVDNVQVDTGSQGLRLLASALPTGFALPAVPAGSGGAPAGACAAFGTGYTWGAVRSADVKLAGETAAALPIQLIADPAVAAAPSGCAGLGLAMTSATTLRANGILGVGPFSADCGAACVNAALSSWYYACPAGACTPSAQPLAQQISNPVAAFATDNNGVVIDLPAIPDSGASSVAGQLIFGIGSQANNALGGATVLRANSVTGYVRTTTSDGSVYSRSYLDSGSNALYFNSSTLTRCGFWYCPATPTSLAATILGIDDASATINVAVTSSQTLFGSGNWAFDNLAGYNASAFGWGLPFFFGRRVFTAIEAQATPAGNGPYFAF